MRPAAPPKAAPDAFLDISFKRIIGNLLVELVIDFDKNNKNRLHRLKPKGTPPGLTPSIKALRLLLALNPCGCGRCPPASNNASKKQKKVDVYFFS
ncbi:MAG: hypothetical protein SPG28_08880 [Alloprevotella sp.]|nr:hypothetical protein [Alloprevotella sp.]